MVPDYAVDVAHGRVQWILQGSTAAIRRKASVLRIIQAEDELAAIGMVLGANWNGAQSIHADERARHFADERVHRLRYYAEIPAVIFNVQRTGPSTGMPTRTQQSDILPAPMRRTATPSTCCCSRRIRTSVSRRRFEAFDLAERCRRR